MKRKLACVLLATVMLLCTAGYRTDSVSGSGFFEAYQILNADVPFAGNLHTAQFDSVKELDEDNFGR